MSVHKRKGSSLWSYSITMVDRFGVKKRERKTIVGVRQKTQAEAFERRRRDEIFEKGWDYLPDPPQKTFREFVFGTETSGKFNTEGTYIEWAKTNKLSWYCDQYRAKTLCRWLGDKPIDGIAEIHIEGFKAARRKEVSDGTIIHELNLLRKIFQIAIQYQLLTDNPCSAKRVKWPDDPPPRERYFSNEELAALFRVAVDYPELYVMMKIALQTGLREGEIMRLGRVKPANIVDLVKGEIIVTKSKTKAGLRTIPISDETQMIIRQHWATTPGDWLFPARRCDTRTAYQPFPDHQWTKVVEVAGVQDAHFHDYRHRCASDMGLAGVDPYTMLRFFGWTKLEMALRYTHTQKANLRAAVDALSHAQGNQAPHQVENAPITSLQKVG